jgi:hypothetical protein
MGDNRDKSSADPGDLAPLEEVLPDAAAIFSWPVENLSKVIEQCDVVLDTNVLLLPYVAGKQSLDALKNVYMGLVGKGRLFVPARVAREFAKNRPSKLSELLKTVSDQKSRVVTPKSLDFPLLAGLPAVERIRKAESLIAAAQAEYVAALDEIHDSILAWGWGDPVTVAYRDTFSREGCIVECILDREQIEKQRDSRYRRKIPPGYKDGGKDDGGIGDFIIWLTILQIAKARKHDMVFVTGEEKADWLYRVNGRGFLPRVELVDEYRRSSDGKTLFIVHLSELLALLNADAEAVKKVRSQENIETVRKRTRRSVAATVACPSCKNSVFCHIGDTIGDSALPTCGQCATRFHVNRVAAGLRIREAGARRSEAIDEMTTWFEQAYDDPANGVPYESAEGGYQYINGGPFDALEVLTEEFSDRYPQRWIENAAGQIEENGTEWIRRGDY